MPTTYTSSLGLALPITGELSGTWGDTVNDYITKYVDAAVAGAQTISGSQTAVTLTTTNGGVLTSAGSGSTGSAQYAIINCTGNPAGLLTITAPAVSKAYLVLNNTSTNQSVKVVATGPTTGVTVAAAQCALIAWNGTDFELVASTDASKLTGVLATANGGTGLSSFTANGVVYASNTSTLATGSALTFDGSNLGVGTASPSAKLHVKVGTDQNLLTTSVSSKVTNLAVNDAGSTYVDWQQYANQFLWFTTSTERMRLDASGNLGLGVTPSAWSAGSTAFQNSAGSIWRFGTNNIYFGQNYYWNGTNRIYSTTNAATEYEQGVGSHKWYTAPSGTAGNAISFTQSMTLDSSGNLGVGTDSPNGVLTLYTGSAFNARTSGINVHRPGSFGQYASIAYNGDATYFSTTYTGGGAGNYGQFIWQAYDTTSAPLLRMQLDQSGNLGLGVTPATGGYGKALQVSDGPYGGAITAQAIDTDLYPVNVTANAVSSGAFTWKYAATASATRYEQVTGSHRWYTAPSGTAGNAISFTEAMRLTSNGELLLGTTSVIGSNTQRVQSPNGFISATDGRGLRLLNSAQTGGGAITANTGTNGGITVGSDAGPLLMEAGGTERARISSTGSWTVNASTSVATGTHTLQDSGSSPNTARLYNSTDSNNTTNRFLICDAAASVLRAEIRSNGGIANFQANNVNLSDVRTKTDIQPAGSYLDKICAIPVKTFLYKDQTDTERNLGVIAQDVDAVAPELIDHSGFGEAPEGESPLLAVYQTDLQYALMKCIQEQQELIKDLRARVAALESK